MKKFLKLSIIAIMLSTSAFAGSDGENELSKKKDVNKSDAILIARFFSETGFKDDLK